MGSSTEKTEGGLRYDGGKVRLDLLPPEWTLALGLVMTAGARKYADRNWERGMKWSKVFGPMTRHILAWLSGESYDRETGCHHLAMVAWNALALMTYETRRIGEQDLPRDELGACETLKWRAEVAQAPASTPLYDADQEARRRELAAMVGRRGLGDDY